MKKTTSLLSIAAATAVISMAAADDSHAKEGMEKCYGVVKAGKNDCGNIAGTHACAGAAKEDADKGEWLYLPKGICERLAGGEVK